MSCNCNSQWWYPRDGVPVRISEMDEGHLDNAVKSMRNKIEWATDRLGVLEREQYRRRKGLRVDNFCCGDN